MNGNDKQYYLSRPSAPPLSEFIEEITPIWNNRMFTNVGEKHKKFASMLADLCGCNNVVLTANGHLSLELALSALQIKGNVITTPFTFASTVMAILRSGAKPVFCDIKEDSFSLDESLIEEHITNETSAILPVHLFGNACNVEKTDLIAKNNGLKVIYDGAQAFGMSINGKNISGFGDATIFSFHATKVMHSIEGGAVFFKDSEALKKAELIKNFGLCGDDALECGFNGKMTEISAAMGICNLKYLCSNIDKRKVLYETYCEILKNVPGIVLCPVDKNISSNYSYMPIRVIEKEFGQSRDKLCEKLNSKNIFPRKYYQHLASDWKIIDEKYRNAHLPIARTVSKQILILPLHQDMEKDDVQYIAESIAEIQKQ